MKTITAVQRIPTENYAYIELQLEYDSVEEAFTDHERLLKLHEAGVGLDGRDWARVRNNMLMTGECDPEDMEQMNKAQRWFTNELKLAMRKLKTEEPTVE